MSGAVYRGPDRRRPPALTGRSTPGAGVALAVVGAATAAVLVADVARAAGWAVGLRPVADTFGVVATALFFGAGVLRYARWRITGEAYMAASSAALLVFASATLPMAMAVRAFGTAPATAVLASVARLSVALVVAATLGRAMSTVDVDSRLRPARLAAKGLVAVVAVFVGLAALLDVGEVRLLGPAPTSSILELVSAAIWLTLAGLCGRAAWERRSASVAWTSAVLATVGVAAVLRSEARSEGISWLVAAGALTVVAAWASAVNALADVREALADESDELLTTTGALADAERLIRDVEARRQELVHDARSMIGALRVASTTLDRHAQDLDPGTTRRLRAAMDVELERLGRLLESPPVPVRPFDVAAVLAPGIAVLRGEGLELVDDLEPAWVVGRPDDLAHVVHNLIVNARRHAPGSRVTVRCERSPGTVRVHVEDGGPGVPAGLAERIFDRGVTSDPGNGEGLGLHLARRLMRDQGGDLELVPRAGGGADFVASLPASTSSATGEPDEEPFEIGEREARVDPVDHDARLGPRVVGQLDDDSGAGGRGASLAQDGDVERLRRRDVGATDDHEAMAGQRAGHDVGQQPRTYVDRRPALEALPPVCHGDEPVTTGASAPRQS